MVVGIFNVSCDIKRFFGHGKGHIHHVSTVGSSKRSFCSQGNGERVNPSPILHDIHGSSIVCI
jgi:hypothetical protein